MSRPVLVVFSVVVAAALWVLWPAEGPPKPVDLGGLPAAEDEAEAAASIVELDPSTDGQRVPAAPAAPAALGGGGEALEDEVPPDEPAIEPGVALLPLSFLERGGAGRHPRDRGPGRDPPLGQGATIPDARRQPPLHLRRAPGRNLHPRGRGTRRARPSHRPLRRGCPEVGPGGRPAVLRPMARALPLRRPAPPLASPHADSLSARPGA